ncbi:MAG: hypothetical protein J6O04_10370 [Selenomonadaceae bacterium]|nr:hypothetical protein [Selenomonadaceae bacterium]
MDMKKFFSGLTVCAFIFAATPVIADLPTVYAAKGGARIAPKSAPKTAAPKSSVKETAPKTGPNQKEYAPSKSAKDLNKEAPKANSAAPSTATNAAANASSGMGNMMRNIGLFAGGMLLGSLIGNALGLGGLGDIFGILANIFFVVLAVIAVRFLWNKFKNRNRNENVYARSNENTYTQSNDIKIPPIGSASNTYEDGYNPKTMADRYRSR